MHVNLPVTLLAREGTFWTRSPVLEPDLGTNAVTLKTLFAAARKARRTGCMVMLMKFLLQVLQSGWGERRDIFD